MVLSLMAAALVASLIARWVARPIYPALAAAQLDALGLRAPPAGAAPEQDSRYMTRPAELARGKE